jgi:hypothetical protein
MHSAFNFFRSSALPSVHTAGASRSPSAPGTGTDPRIAATVVLLGITACAIFAKALAPAPHFGPAVRPAPPAVRFVDPGPADLCAHQTWPYIDARCLKRADTPEPPAAQSSAPSIPEPQVTQAVPVAQSSVGVASTEKYEPAVPPVVEGSKGSVPHNNLQSVPIDPPPGATATKNSNPVGPTALGRDTDTEVQTGPSWDRGALSAAGQNLSQPTADVSQHHRSHYRRHTFFGFRF